MSSFPVSYISDEQSVSSLYLYDKLTEKSAGQSGMGQPDIAVEEGGFPPTACKSKPVAS